MKTSRKIIALAGALALLAVPVAAQQGQRGQSGQRGQQSQRGSMNTMGQRMSQQMTVQQRQTIRANQQQSKGVRACTGIAAGVQARARELAGRAGSGGGFNGTRARSEGAGMSEQVQKMLRQHDQLIEGMNGQQLYWLQDQVRDLDHTRDRIRDRLQELSSALGVADPEPARVVQYSDELAQEMEQWQAQYHQMGTDMGVNFDDEEEKK
ncbi:MAG: hypothetical protein PVJ49_13195 [Acidobacteriota bacterium]|jgi:hypothetical protein